MAAGENSFGILPVALGKPQECDFTGSRTLNGGSYSDGLIVVGDAVCASEQTWAEGIPYYWREGSWVRAQLPGGAYVEAYIDGVSDDPAQEPVMLYVARRSVDSGFGELVLLVVEPGQAPVELVPLAGMRLTIGDAAISGSGNSVVAHSGSGDWDTGYTRRAVRWTRMEDGWSPPEDIAEGIAVSVSADGQRLIGNGDGEDWGATGGNAWVWDADGDGGRVLASLGTDARVYDITHSGEVIVGSRAEPCMPDDWCDFFEWPVYWVQVDGQWVMHDLPVLDGAIPRMIAVAEIDGQAVILGEAYIDRHGGIIRAVVWQPDEKGAYGAPLELETIGANPTSFATALDINREGIVLGWSELKPWGSGSDVIWSLKEILPFQINPGIGDAWYNPETDGQGFFINVWENIQTMFVGWYTYGAGAADGSHYWMTAQGPYSDNVGQLEITLSEGGTFDSPQPAPQRTPDGTMTIEFTSCLEGTVTYDIPSIGRQGAIPIRRLTHDQVFYCESRSVPGGE
jgi:hypothetical protein